MTSNAPFKTLPLGKSGKVALVDAGDYSRLRCFSWSISHGHVHDYVRRHRFPLGSGSVQLSHDVLNLPPRVRVRFINGDTLDCRRANLQPLYGTIREVKGLRRTPYRVKIHVDGVQFHVGYFPSRRTAEQAKQIAGEVGAQVRGRGLSHRQVQRQLDLATGQRVRSRYVRIGVQQESARAA